MPVSVVTVPEVAIRFVMVPEDDLKTVADASEETRLVMAPEVAIRFVMVPEDDLKTVADASEETRLVMAPEVAIRFVMVPEALLNVVICPLAPRSCVVPVVPKVVPVSVVI